MEKAILNRLDAIEKKLNKISEAILKRDDVALSVQQAAHMIHTSTATIYRLLQKEVLKKELIGGVYGISRMKLKDYEESK